MYLNQLGSLIATLRHYGYHLFWSTDSLSTTKIGYKKYLHFNQIWEYTTVTKLESRSLAISWSFLLNLEDKMDKDLGLQKRTKKCIKLEYIHAENWISCVIEGGQSSLTGRWLYLILNSNATFGLYLVHDVAYTPSDFTSMMGNALEQDILPPYWSPRACLHKSH